MGDAIDDEIPLLLASIYLFRCFESGPLLDSLFLELNGSVLTSCPRSTRETKSGGEFGWGGTSVKR